MRVADYRSHLEIFHQNESMKSMGAPSTLLNVFLPEFHYNEIHRISIRASASSVFRAIKEVTPSELPLLVHFLFFARSLPTRLTSRYKSGLKYSKPILEQILGVSFILLGEDVNHEEALGIIGKFWRATSDRSNRKPARDAREFMEFNKPGFAKTVLNFQVIEESDHVLVRTETRIQALGSKSRSKFSIYWRLILPGSALIRVLWLNAIKRRAEKSRIRGDRKN